MPSHHLLELYNGETFKDSNTIFNQYQDYTLVKTFLLLHYSQVMKLLYNYTISLAVNTIVSILRTTAS